ncbi:MaoC family dehydratase [Micromonospora sp. NPDC005113]
MSLAVVDRLFGAYEVGERFTSMGRTIDQSDVNAFAGLTLDLHPAHLDAEFADPRYGGRLAHGMLTFSVVTGLLVEYNLRAISYGYDKVRFPGPVRSGDTVRATSEVVELRDAKSPIHGLVVKQYLGYVGDATVFSCLHILAVERGDA